VIALSHRYCDAVLIVGAASAVGSADTTDGNALIIHMRSSVFGVPHPMRRIGTTSAEEIVFEIAALEFARVQVHASRSDHRCNAVQWCSTNQLALEAKLSAALSDHNRNEVLVGTVVRY
jgi:hypothetical protein